MLEPRSDSFVFALQPTKHPAGIIKYNSVIMSTFVRPIIILLDVNAVLWFK